LARHRAVFRNQGFIGSPEVGADLFRWADNKQVSD
jgi:hypothetical protein